MVTLNSRDLGMEYSFELTGTNEREVMRKFIEYAETELKMPGTDRRYHLSGADGDKKIMLFSLVTNTRFLLFM